MMKRVSTGVVRSAQRAMSSAAGPGTPLVLMRHGQSTWNLENRFTGWVDVPLTDKGMEEARRGGRELAKAGFEFDVAYTSVLQRAIKTLFLASEEAEQLWLPVIKDYRLNERHYGGLSGLNKAETAAIHGDELVKQWRRSFDIPPPVMEPSNEFNPGNDRRYAGLDPAQVPMTESLKITCERVVPFWEEVLAPQVAAGKRLLIVAHGNSLRALVKHLDGISESEIVNLNIPTGVPLVYRFDGEMRPIPQPAASSPLSGEYLGDQDAIRAEAERVAQQASAQK